MIYIIGYFISFIALIILLINGKTFLPKLNKIEKISFIILSISIIIPMLYGFINGIISR